MEQLKARHRLVCETLHDKTLKGEDTLLTLAATTMDRTETGHVLDHTLCRLCRRSMCWVGEPLSFRVFAFASELTAPREMQQLLRCW